MTLIHVSMPPVRPTMVEVQNRHGNANGPRYAISLDSPHVMVRNERIYFEFDPRFGPTVLDANGQPKRRQPAEKNAFWDAFGIWLADYNAKAAPPAPNETEGEGT